MLCTVAFSSLCASKSVSGPHDALKYKPHRHRVPGNVLAISFNTRLSILYQKSTNDFAILVAILCARLNSCLFVAILLSEAEHTDYRLFLARPRFVFSFMMALVSDIPMSNDGHAVSNPNIIRRASESSSIFPHRGLAVNFVGTASTTFASIVSGTKRSVQSMLDRSTGFPCEYLLPGVANFKRALLASDMRCLDVDTYSSRASKHETNEFIVTPNASCLVTKAFSANGNEQECLVVAPAADEFTSSEKREAETADTATVVTSDTYCRYDKTALLAVLQNSRGLKTRATVKALLQPDPRSRKIVCEAKKYVNQERLANDSASARFRRQYFSVVEELTQKQFLNHVRKNRPSESSLMELQTSQPNPSLKEVAFPYVRNLHELKLPEIKQKKKSSPHSGPLYQAKSSSASLSEKTKHHHAPHVDTSLPWRSQKVVEEQLKPTRASRAYSEKWKGVTCSRSRIGAAAQTCRKATVVSKTLSSSL
ncbi:hypothetical protein TGRUB_205020 [Toxoplasma gondii RUB]|nr:hypothetical protein TGRUB_205020 [Toxoplasma gondii RUB]KFH00431.1 hypothetical protein TGVAND_205020 [Toxoplasma gondii VAND]